MGDVKRKLSDGEVPDRPQLEQPLPESDRLRRRGIGVREGTDLAADVRWIGSAVRTISDWGTSSTEPATA